MKFLCTDYFNYTGFNIPDSSNVYEHGLIYKSYNDYFLLYFNGGFSMEYDGKQPRFIFENTPYSLFFKSGSSFGNEIVRTYPRMYYE